MRWRAPSCSRCPRSSRRRATPAMNRRCHRPAAMQRPIRASPTLVLAIRPRAMRPTRSSTLGPKPCRAPSRPARSRSRRVPTPSAFAWMTDGCSAGAATAAASWDAVPTRAARRTLPRPSWSSPTRPSSRAAPPRPATRTARSAPAAAPCAGDRTRTASSGEPTTRARLSSSHPRPPRPSSVSAAKRTPRPSA